MARLWARTTGPWRSTVKPHGLVAAEHSLQRQIADALRLKIAPPGKVSRDGGCGGLSKWCTSTRSKSCVSARLSWCRPDDKPDAA
jgi:hypothetical protein